MPPYQKKLMNYGDKIVVYFEPTVQSMIMLQQGKTFDCKYGHFLHSNFVGKEYGTKVVKTNKIWSNSNTSFGYALKPDRSLYTATLTHRTQILYSIDIAFVIANLGIRPGIRVVESGTGSGSLTYSLMKALGGKGELFSFEYNKERAEAAQKEFKELKADNVVY